MYFQPFVCFLQPLRGNTQQQQFSTEVSATSQCGPHPQGNGIRSFDSIYIYNTGTCLKDWYCHRPVLFDCCLHSEIMDLYIYMPVCRSSPCLKWCPTLKGLHSPGVRKHCQMILSCYFWKWSILKGSSMLCFVYHKNNEYCNQAFIVHAYHLPIKSWWNSETVKGSSMLCFVYHNEYGNGITISKLLILIIVLLSMHGVNH